MENVLLATVYVKRLSQRDCMIHWRASAHLEYSCSSNRMSAFVCLCRCVQISTCAVYERKIKTKCEIL